MFHYHNTQCSIDSTIPRKLLPEDKLVRTLFKKKVFLLFGEKADAIITKYPTPSRCRFTVLFGRKIDDTEYYEKLVKRLIKWVIIDAEAEYDKKTSDNMGIQIVNDFKNYKELQKIC